MKNLNRPILIGSAIVLVVVIFVFCLLFFGTNVLRAPTYDQAVLSASSQVPCAVQLEELHPSATHFITHYNMGGKMLYNAEVCHEDGYRITIQAEIEFERVLGGVTVVSDPEIYLIVYTEVYNDHGNWGGRIDTSIDQHISKGDWQAYVESGGDIGVLGVEDASPLEGWSNFVNASTQTRRSLDSLR